MRIDITTDHAATIEELCASRRPGWSLPRPFYMDEAIYRVEMARIFRRGWLFAGHTCQIPETGDYLTYELDGDSILLTRGRDGRIQALFNVCRHRGARVCSRPSGRANRLVCPYHQWTYDLDGRLLAAASMDGAPCLSELGLHRAHVRELDGLIFVSLAHDPPSFAEAHDRISAVIRPHGLDRAKVAHVVSRDIAANWKLVVENQRECYHCPARHPEYVRVHYDTQVDDPAMQAEIEARLVECRARWAALGLDVSAVSASSAYTGPWYRANRTPLRPGFVTESLDGRPVAPLMGDFTEPDVGTARANTYLNFWLHATGDHAATVLVTPLGPSMTRTMTTWLVRGDAVLGVDYDLDRLTAFTLTQSRQDWAILENQALGVRSSRYESGPYSGLKEANVERFVLWYLEQVGGGC